MNLIERLRDRRRKCLKCFGVEVCNYCQERTEAADELERLSTLTENDGIEIGSFRKGTGLRGEIRSLEAEIERLEGALNLIGSCGCERIFSKDPQALLCPSQEGWSKDAKYGADRWCDPCIANEALSEDT